MAKVIVHRKTQVPPIERVELTLSRAEALYLKKLIAEQPYQMKGPQRDIYDQLSQIEFGPEISTTGDPIEGGPLKCGYPGCIGHQSGQGVHDGGYIIKRR